MDPREDPALEISKLQTILERLVSKRLPMNDMVAAMMAIVAMPDNWDHVASLILSTTEIDDLNIPHIVPIIQEEYKRRQAKRQVPIKEKEKWSTLQHMKLLGNQNFCKGLIR